MREEFLWSQKYRPKTVADTILPANIKAAFQSYVDQKDSDLFTVFNVIQENLIKGGIRGYRLNKYGYTTRTKTREVKAIDQNVKLNRALWTLTEKMMEMKR